ncbi:hypothetical protein EV580_1304 [Mycobacterium sp. BK086]|uniref:phage fiber-tail adaptor protein n=1 Tax=Mycobacterium sp. BK086 TaxID=2512165 RepID=UPI001061B942|nr:hypothetical protein [Mycobacterium sp. BK086]TDO18122.1 hypothetical protein EV580_1304 [Mycobacterium sp. BK086]
MTAIVGLGTGTKGYNPFEDPYHPVHIKDPSAVLDYPCDWRNLLVRGDFIVATRFELESGIYLASEPAFTDVAAIAWIGGGTVDTDYTVVCHITTNRGRQDDRSFVISIQET